MNHWSLGFKILFGYRWYICQKKCSCVEKYRHGT